MLLPHSDHIIHTHTHTNKWKLYIWICPGTTSISIYRSKHTFDLKKQQIGYSSIRMVMTCLSKLTHLPFIDPPWVLCLAVPGFLLSSPHTHPTRAWERGHFGPIFGSSTSRDTSTMQICSNWLILHHLWPHPYRPPNQGQGCCDHSQIMNSSDICKMVQTLKVTVQSIMQLSTLNLPLFYTYNIIIVYLFVA